MPLAIYMVGIKEMKGREEENNANLLMVHLSNRRTSTANIVYLLINSFICIRMSCGTRVSTSRIASIGHQQRGRGLVTNTSRPSRYV